MRPNPNSEGPGKDKRDLCIKIGQIRKNDTISQFRLHVVTD